MQNYDSLLALDSFASEEMLRIAAYSRALDYKRTVPKSPPAEEVAERFVAFVGDERWRLDVLDVALKDSTRRMSLDNLMLKAVKIADWTKPQEVEVPVVADLDPAPAQERRQPVKKKPTAKRK